MWWDNVGWLMFSSSKIWQAHISPLRNKAKIRNRFSSQNALNTFAFSIYSVAICITSATHYIQQIEVCQCVLPTEFTLPFLCFCLPQFSTPTRDVTAYEKRLQCPIGFWEACYANQYFINNHKDLHCAIFCATISVSAKRSNIMRIETPRLVITQFTMDIFITYWIKRRMHLGTW